MNNRTDHDILIAVEIELKELKEQFTNHLAHHRKLAYALIAIAGSAFIALSIVVVNLLMLVIF